MPTGIMLYARPDAANVVDDVVAQARRAHEIGVRQVWLAQQFDHEAITLAALVGAAVPGLGVGTSVVPINPRHPLIMASLAQTAQAASHGNFSLGLGLGAHEPERQAFGTSWPNTVQRLREHLTVLRSVFAEGAVDFHGDEFTASPGWPVAVPGGAPLPVYVAAMGPKALQRHRRTRRRHTALPCRAEDHRGVHRTDDREGGCRCGQAEPAHHRGGPGAGDRRRRRRARNIAAQQLSFYETIPSYQRVIAREGVDSVAELAAVGPAESVARQLKTLPRRRRDGCGAQPA